MMPHLPHTPLWFQDSLISSWGVTSKIPLPLPYRRWRLERHLQYVFLVDWLIQGGGGVERMSQEDIEQVKMVQGETS